MDIEKKNKELADRIKVLESENISLKDQLQFYRLFNEYSNNWETFRDKVGNLVFVSPSVLSITGYSSDDFMKGRIDFISLVYSEDIEICQDYLKKQLNKESFSDFVCRIYDKLKNIKYLSVSSKPVYDDLGEYIGFRTSCIDVTENRKLSLKQKESADEISLLNQVNSEMIQLSELSSIYKYIVGKLTSRFSNTIILYNSINNSQNESTLEAIAGLSDNILTKVLKIIGFNPIGKKFKLIPTFNDYYLSGKFVQFKGGLSDFSSSEFPTIAAKALEKLIGINKIYTMGIKKDEQLLASIHFFTFNKSVIEDINFIEAFIYLSGIILQKKIAEHALLESQQKYKLLFDSAPDAIIIHDEQRNILAANPQAVERFGYTHDELLKFKVDNLITAEQVIFANERTEKLKKEGKNVFETVHKRKDGSLIPTDVSSKQVIWDGVSSIMGICRDITERKQAENHLRKIEEQARKNNELLKSILESPKGIIIFSLDTKYQYSAFTLSHQQTMKKILNVDIEIGMNMLDSISNSKDREKAQSNFDKALRGEHFLLEEEYGEKGLYRTFWENRYSPILNNNKEIVGLTVFVTDITERKQFQNALHQSVEKTQAIMNANPDLIFHLKSNGLILSYYAPDISQLYLPPVQFIGKTILEVLPPQITEPSMLAMSKSLKTREMVTFEYELLFNNELHYYECRVIALLEDEALSFVRDITDKKLAEVNLKNLNIQLHELNATKDKLFSIIAHDLRSPFSSIVGLSGLLEKNILNYNPEKSKNIVEHINQAAINSMNLLENLLEWAKSQSGKISFDLQKLELSILIDEVISVLRPSAAVKNISLNYFQTERIVVSCDEHMLKTILRNLISNAIKYSNTGGKVNIYGQNTHSETIISVSDNGIGMTNEIKDKLFSIDQKMILPGTANEKGSGLGLVLCKEFVEKHGGKIWAESIEGKGSEFKFTLPVERI